MVFIHNDFYTASGSLKLYHSWTDKVTKFDTSSFYNWEQDNLPLYDLDERTYYLWEQLGHPTSSLPGVCLVVSAGGDPAEYEYNRNNFETLGEAIEALPQVLNYPVIIEICNKGDLGELHLKNIKCGPQGSLEIVNKVFAKAEPEFNLSSLNLGSDYTDTPYNLISSLSSVLPSSTYNVSFSPRKHFLDSKSEFLNKSIYDTTALTGLNNELNGFVTVISEALNTRATYFTKTGPIGSDNQVINLSAFEYTSEAINNHLVSAYDISAYDKDSGIQYIPASATEDSNFNRMVGLFYGNTVSKVLITNCDGPIFVRNIFVDGSGYTTKNKNGFEIANCREVYLENCVSVKNTNAGFNISNSKVIITRGIGAYRNYNYINDQRLIDPSSDQNFYRDVRDFAAGLIATNSEIEFSSTSEFEKAKFDTDPVFSAVSSFGSLSYGLNYPINFSRNANGIVLINSNLTGGKSGSFSTTLICELNNLCGFRILNSNLNWDGRLKARQNTVGLLSENSKLILDKYTIRENTRIGMLLNKSSLIYNKNLIKPTSTEYQFSFNLNGQHIKLNESEYSYLKTTSIPTKYGLHYLLNCKQNAVDVENSSKLIMIHPYLRGRKKHPVSVKNNSNAILKGSKNHATTIFGAYDDDPRYSCGIIVDNNSKVDIQGPTCIGEYAIDILAENNSTINLTPHRDENNNSLQINEFNLSDAGNHTMVELHARRSCLVVNKNSNLNIEDLGSYFESWPKTAAGTAAIGSDILDYTVTSFASAVSGGFLQFYPNPLFVGSNTLTLTSNDTFTYGDVINGKPAPYYLLSRTSNNYDFSSVTRGGVCVRAISNSIVNVKSVDFPTGWWNASGLFFDGIAPIEQGGLCNKLFIWNIADDSKLNASYCSLSSTFPPDVGYHGSYGVWLSSLQDNATISGSVVSAAYPYNEDPYTLSAALLDYAGSGPSSIENVSGLFLSSFANQGPFRLYFSTDPICNLLTIVSASPYSTSLNNNYFKYGWISQIFSQGYNPPGYLKTSGAFTPPVSATSALFRGAIRYTESPAYQFTNSGIFKAADTGFAYTPGEQSPTWQLYGGMMHAPNSARVFLDESAANIFANAKHCATGKSGAPKVVSIYYANRSGGGDSNTTSKEIGFGIHTLNSFDLNRDN